MRTDGLIRVDYRLIMRTLWTGFLFFSLVLTINAFAEPVPDITETMTQQANDDLTEIMRQNDQVDVSLFDMAKHFINTWLDVPRIKFNAWLHKIFMPKFKESVPVAESDLVFSWIEGLCQWDHRRPGTPNGHAAEEWIADKFREFGLQDVTMQPIDIDVWTPDEWSLTVEGEKIPAFFSVNTGLTEPDGVSAPLAYVGLGLPSDFERVDVNGKIAVVEILFPYLPSGGLLSIPNSNYFISDPENSIQFLTGQYLTFFYMNLYGDKLEWEPDAPDVPMKKFWSAYDMAVENGAKGVALLLANKPSKYNTQYGLYDGVMNPVPAVWVGKYDAIRLRRLAREKKSATLVQTGTLEPGYMRNVYGILPGQSEDTVIICSHHDSSFKGAVEDGTGITQVFAQAWAWAQVPIEKRPKTLVFVAAAGHLYGGWGGFSFAYEHPEIMEKTWLVMNLEHLAAKEVKEHRGEYKETGLVSPSIIWTEENPKVLAALWKAMDRKPAKRAVSLPAYYWIPFSDVPGYVSGATANGLPKVPIISWISNPYYLLDEQDTPDRVEQEELGPLAGTITEIVKNFMVMKKRP